MNKLLIIPLILVVALGLVLSACKEPSPSATTPVPTTPGATTPSATTPSSTTPTSTSQPTPTPTETTPPAPSGTITSVVADFGTETFDGNLIGAFWGSMVFDYLLYFSTDGTALPAVAESYEFDPVSGIYTFHIRDDIYCTDGVQLTAEDVKYSIDRYGLPTSQSAWSLYISEGYNKVACNVIDDFTVEFVPDHPELQQILPFASMFVYPKHGIEEMGEEAFFKNPFGYGPWKTIEIVPDTSAKFEVNTDYWGVIPEYQYVTELEVPEQSTRVAMLRRGDADIAYNIDYDRMAELGDEGFRLEPAGLPYFSSIAWQGTWMPGAGAISDIRIRQALSMSLNRQEIADNWYQGFAEPGSSWFLARGEYGWDEDLMPDAFDLAGAQALMAEANYPDAFDNPVITIYASALDQDYVSVLLGYWEAAGFQTHLEVVDLGTYWGYLFKPPAPGDPNVGWGFTWTSQTVPNSTYHAANLYTSRGVTGTANDPTADAMYDEYIRETDPVKAEQLWHDFRLYVKGLYIHFGIVQIEGRLPVSSSLGDFEFPENRAQVFNQESYQFIKH